MRSSTAALRSKEAKTCHPLAASDSRALPPSLFNEAASWAENSESNSSRFENGRPDLRSEAWKFSAASIVVKGVGWALRNAGGGKRRQLTRVMTLSVPIEPI